MSSLRRCPKKKKSPTPELSPRSSDGVAGSDDAGEFAVEAITDHLTYKEAVKKFPHGFNGFNPNCYLQKIHCKYVFRVRWLGFGPASDTWEVEDNLVGNEKYIIYKQTHMMPKEVKKERFFVRDFLKFCYLGGDEHLSPEVKAILEKEHGKVAKKGAADNLNAPSTVRGRKSQVPGRTTDNYSCSSLPLTKRKTTIATTVDATSSKFPIPPSCKKAATAKNGTSSVYNSPISSKRVPSVRAGKDSSKESSPELVIKKSKVEPGIEVISRSGMDTETPSVDSSDSSVILSVKRPVGTMNNAPSTAMEVSSAPSLKMRPSVRPLKKESGVSSPSPTQKISKTSPSVPPVSDDSPSEISIELLSEESSAETTASSIATPPQMVVSMSQLMVQKSPLDRRRKRPEHTPSPSSKESSPELIVKKTKKDDSVAVNVSTSKLKRLPSIRPGASSSDIGADKMDKDHTSLWISGERKERLLEKKRKIVGAEEQERISGLDALEEMETRLRQEKKKKKGRESRESRDSDSEDKSARKERKQRTSLDRSASPEISFRQRERAQEEARLRNNVAKSASLFADPDIFDSGSSIASGAPSPEPARLMEMQPQAIKKKQGYLPQGKLVQIRQWKEEEDRKKMAQAKAREEAERERMAQAKAREEADGEKRTKAHARVVLPTLPSKTPASPPTLPSTRIPKKPKPVVVPKVPVMPTKKKDPPVFSSAAGSGLDLMDSIVSDMDKVRTNAEMPFVPGPAPVPAPPALLPNSENLLLKSAPKPKKDIRKIPPYNYNARLASTAGFPAPSKDPKKISPLVLPLKNSIGVTIHDSMVDFEPTPMEVEEEPAVASVMKAKAPKDKDEEKDVVVVRRLAQPFYPTYHHRLMNDFGLLERKSWTTDDLPLETSSKLFKFKYWEESDKVMAAAYRKSRAENMNSIKLQFSNLKIHVPMDWNEDKKVWKRNKGKGDELKETLKEIRAEIKASPPKVFKAVALEEVSKVPQVIAMETEEHPSKDREQESENNATEVVAPPRQLVANIEDGQPLAYYRPFAIEAYKLKKAHRLRNIIIKIPSVVQRFSLIKELISTVIPNANGEFDIDKLWLVEADECQYGEWWHGLHFCCAGKKHNKCMMLGALLSTIPDKMRFHSQGPFHASVVMHCMCYGAFCQKQVFFEYGVPTALCQFVTIPSKRSRDLALDAFAVILCQTKPWQVVEMLGNGHCPNSVVWRHSPPDFEADPVANPIPLEDAFKEIVECGIPLDTDRLAKVAKGMLFFAKALQKHMTKKIDSIVKDYFPGFKIENLTPVHTLLTTGASQTANAYSYLIDGGHVWTNLTTDEYGGIDKNDIPYMREKETFLVITVARVAFVGGVKVDAEGRSLYPLTVQPLYEHHATPLSLSLCAINTYTPRPNIVINKPETTKDVDTWFFVVPPDQCDLLLKMIKQRIRIALDTKGKLGVKFLVQMHMLDKKNHPPTDPPKVETHLVDPTDILADSHTDAPSSVDPPISVPYSA